MEHSGRAERGVLRGAGARSENRTVFAVGDEKQSIFSFQGAAPEKFAEMKRAFDKRCRDAERPFDDVPLTFSFRSSPTILDAVDRTFRSELAWRGVAAPGEPPPKHEAIRRDLKGLVELWPPIAPSPAPDPQDWRMPLDERAAGRPCGDSGSAHRRSHQGLAIAAFARAHHRREHGRNQTHSRERRIDPGSQAQRLLRGDDPGSEGGSMRRSPAPTGSSSTTTLR